MARIFRGCFHNGICIINAYTLWLNSCSLVKRTIMGYGRFNIRTNKIPPLHTSSPFVHQLCRTRKKSKLRWQRKKLQMRGAQILRSEAYLWVRRNDEGCRATTQMDFLRSHQLCRDCNARHSHQCSHPGLSAGG